MSDIFKWWGWCSLVRILMSLYSFSLLLFLYLSVWIYNNFSIHGQYKSVLKMFSSVTRFACSWILAAVCFYEVELSSEMRLCHDSPKYDYVLLFFILVGKRWIFECFYRTFYGNIIDVGIPYFLLVLIRFNISKSILILFRCICCLPSKRSHLKWLMAIKNIAYFVMIRLHI